jgi:hypothetical protein
MKVVTQAAVEYAALAFQRAAGTVGRQITRLGDFAGEHRALLVSCLVGLAILYLLLRPRSRRRR